MLALAPSAPPCKNSGMAGYRLGLYEKSMPAALELADKLRATRAAGFDFLELSIDESDGRLARLGASPAERRAWVLAMLDTGVRLETMCLSGHRRFPIGSAEPEVARRGMEIMADAVALSADLGIRVIQLAGYDVYYSESTEDTRRRFAANLEECVELAAARGVVLAFETMETEFMNTVAKALGHVRRVDSPWLQVYPDVGNVTNAARAAGTSALDDLRAGRGRIAAVHLKETVPGKFREIPFGTGHVDFDGCIREALAMGVRLFVAELWAPASGDWRAPIEQASAFLRRKFPAP
jgi:L-ribulose-5-phosphate 3-epimerase